MGIADILKKAFGLGEPPFKSIERQCIIYERFTMRLPSGWQFTEGDNMSFQVSGPARCTVLGDFRTLPVKMGHFEKYRKSILRCMQIYLQDDSAQETNLSSGVIWMEKQSAEPHGRVLKISIFNTRAGSPDAYAPPVIQTLVTAPNTTPDAISPDACFAQFRAALHTIEWR